MLGFKQSTLEGKVRFSEFSPTGYDQINLKVDEDTDWRSTFTSHILRPAVHKRPEDPLAFIAYLLSINPNELASDSSLLIDNLNTLLGRPLIGSWNLGYYL
eukprot:Nk52_evm13s1916 gene=Nk52_evmTU13s1916